MSYNSLISVLAFVSPWQWSDCQLPGVILGNGAAE
jgi:hypothetical protein